MDCSQITLRKNNVISPNSLMRELSGHAISQFRQNFHTSKLGKITVFMKCKTLLITKKIDPHL